MATLPVGVLQILLGLQVQRRHLLRILANRGAFIHVPLGALAGLLHGTSQLALAAIFAGYEISKPPTGKRWADIGGAFVEFGIGAGLVALVLLLGGHR